MEIAGGILMILGAAWFVLAGIGVARLGDSLARVHADVAVISSAGVKPEGAVVTDLTHEASIKGRMREAADRSILVANATKFPGTGSYRIASIADFDAVVTTAQADSRALATAARAGVEDVRVTAKRDHPIEPLPEGASYLGFIFARAGTGAAAEAAVRAAHRHLQFSIDPAIDVRPA